MANGEALGGKDKGRSLVRQQWRQQWRSPGCEALARGEPYKVWLEPSPKTEKRINGPQPFIEIFEYIFCVVWLESHTFSFKDCQP